MHTISTCGSQANSQTESRAPNPAMTPTGTLNPEAMQVSVVRHHHASVVRLIVRQQAEESKGLILFHDHHHVVGHAL